MKAKKSSSSPPDDGIESLSAATQSEILGLYSAHVSPGKVDIYSKYNLVLIPGRRSGCRIFDINGKAYYNCHCNGGVFNLGHRHPLIINAVKKALAGYDIGNHHLVSAPRARLAGMISDAMPQGLDQVMFGVSGGEAIDLAIKLARGVTGRPEIISAEGGYHGHTGFALAAGDKKFSEKFGPMAPGFRQVPFNDIDALKSAVTPNTAAVLLETVPATAGIIVPDKNYFADAREICRSAGALLILDEVQTGFGRTGKLWGFQHFGVEPDIVVLGKGMSGGIYPITATVYRGAHAGFFRADPFVHISTFGGSEIGCFAAMETLSISRDTQFLENVTAMSALFKEKLEALGRRYKKLGLQVRGLGLMMGLKFKDEMTALFLMKLFFDNGVYTVYSGNDPSVIQFLPPLIATGRDASQILLRIKKAFKTLIGGGK